MPNDPRDLIHGYFDETLTEQQIGELSAWIAQDPDHARLFAKAAFLHDGLRNQFRAQAELAHNENQAVPSPVRSERRVLFGWKGVALLTSSVAAVLVAFLFFQGFRGDSASAAEAELKRLIQVTQGISDRSYLITALDGGEPQNHPVVDNQKKGGRLQLPIDGAILHTRGPGQYVLIRKFADGAEFITGSDGKTSWACPPVKEGKKGNVRVSNDPLRFRGPVPGQQHNIPFVDIRSDLGQLREAYELTLLPAKLSPGGSEKWKGIRAERREQAAGGPKRVEIWYVPTTGVIQQMRFDGMPRAKGGPRSLLVELIEQRDLGPGFFEHAAHHGPERRVLPADD